MNEYTLEIPWIGYNSNKSPLADEVDKIMGVEVNRTLRNGDSMDLERIIEQESPLIIVNGVVPQGDLELPTEVYFSDEPSKIACHIIDEIIRADFYTEIIVTHIPTKGINPSRYLDSGADYILDICKRDIIPAYELRRIVEEILGIDN